MPSKPCTEVVCKATYLGKIKNPSFCVSQLLVLEESAAFWAVAFSELRRVLGCGALLNLLVLLFPWQR